MVFILLFFFPPIELRSVRYTVFTARLLTAHFSLTGFLHIHIKIAKHFACLSQWRRQGGPGGAHAPPKICCAPHLPPQMRSVLCIKIYQKIFKKYNAADKPNGMKYDCIRIHALHWCVITNVIIQSTAIASLPATSFPGSYLRSSGEMTRCW